MEQLPHLYKRRKDGKLHKWMIWAKDDCVYRQDHLVGGKIKDPTARFCDGTNIGKSNERSPQEQAIAEAKRNWAKQLDKGYEPDPSDTPGQNLFRQVMNAKYQSGFKNHDIMDRAINNTVNTLSQKKNRPAHDKRLFPMLAMEWSKKKTKIDLTHGAYVQPKVDGVRCLARMEGGKVLLTSRTGKNFPHFSHIKKDLLSLLNKNPGVILDGELYSHNMIVIENGKERVLDKTERWELISGMCSIARTKPHESEELIYLYVFDIYDPEGKFSQEERFNALDEIFSTITSSSIIRLTTEIVYSEDEIMSKHDEWVEVSYEGVVVRDKRAKYLPGPTKRSEFLLKFKKFDTDEFTIVDAKEGNGTEKGCVIWICVTEDGKRFACRPQGNKKKRQDWWENQTEFFGKDLTIKYQGMDPKTKTPRFPVGIDVDRFSKE